MAIIRKGDKKAEAKLKERALTQSIARIKASDLRKNKAGLSYMSKDEKTISSDPARIKVKRNEDGKTTATVGNIIPREFEGPVSGGRIAASKTYKKKTLEKKGSGVISKGKKVK